MGCLMKFSAIKGLIGAVAPTLGAALGTPIAGAAVQVLTNVLGCKPDEKSIEQAMSQASAEDLAKIREAELEFDEKMKQMDVDILIGLSTQESCRMPLKELEPILVKGKEKLLRIFTP